MDANLAFLAAIVESSDDAIIGITPDGRIASWNSGARAIYGYSAVEIIGQPIARLALPERHDEIALLQTRLHRGERVKHFRTLHLTRQGRMLHISLSVSPIIDSTGRLLGASAIARDITERLQAEEALRVAQEKYQLIFSAETDAILLFETGSGRLVDFNDAALQLYGYDRATFANLTLADLCPECPPGMKADRRAVTTHASPIRHRRSDGTLFPAEMSTSAFVWQQRTLQVGIVRDISERQHSRHLLQSLAVAREIQRHLLPQRPPAIAGLDIHAGSISCEEIGGDYYDFFTPPGQGGARLGFVVGDVSGHGIGAALLMAMIRGLLHSEVENCGCNLTAIQAAMNRHLLAAAEDSSFMTLFCGLLDPQTFNLEWSSAGHAPIFWYQSRPGLMRELHATAVPIGITADETFPLGPPLQLAPGDILLVGTDGLWEARNPGGDMFQPHRIRQLLATWAPKSARQIHDAITGKVQEFMAGQRPSDDMTLLVLKVTG